ncbi:MAG: hypothetical protein GY866_37555 [Proteobacteria bacterium]|nr:hypothetical protein [Pseudomonadota bacterium]
MENVFWNVLWGSLCGGMLLVGWATMDDSKETSERYSFGTLSTQFLTGATYGGLLGLTAGVYFSIKGISFDENLTRIAFTPNTNQVPEELRYNAFTKPKSASGKIHLMNLQIRF